MIARDGTIVYFHDNVTVIVENDEPVLLRGIMTDITARKKAGEELQISHDRLFFHLENSPLAFIEWDSQIKPKLWSKRAEEIFGLTEKEAISKQLHWFSKVHEEDLPRVVKMAEQLVSGQLEKTHVQHRNYTKDGRVIWCEWFNSVLKDNDGKVITILSLIQDITKRKTAELELAESEQKYRTLFEQNLAGFYQSTIEGVILNCNDAFAKMLKYDSPNDLLRVNATELYFSPADRNNFITNLIDEKKLYSHEGVLRCKDGSPLYFLENMSLRKDIITGGELRDGILIDITERKLAELRLKENETVITDLNKNLKKRAEELACQNQEKEKRAAELIIANKELIFQNGEKRKRAAELIIANKELIFQNEEKEKRAAELIIANKELIIQNEEKGKRATELIIANKELKKAEDELIKLSMVAKETINGVVIRDKDQNIVWVNNAFTKMYGYELDEVIGRNPKSFLPGPETDAELVKHVKKLYLQKEPFVFEILNYTSTGNKIYARIQVQPIFDEKGDIKESFALHTDITKQKELEEKVEQEKVIKQKQITNAVFEAQENERSEIGRELHDNVNQLLSAIRMYIDLARTDEKSRDSLLNDASGFALSAIEEIRKLSKTLIIPLIKEVGLKDVVQNLIGEIMLVHPVKILFTADEFNEAGLNNKFKLNIFRIVQEQINNILKHAHSENIDINIEDNYGKLLISISDDGIGFDTTKGKAGVGITNIKSRCELYNGSLRLNSEVGKGTTLSLTFNKAELLNDNNTLNS